MKNISRRVFIKGLAVAGVAAAASTVLAGCNTNMIPGVDEGEGEIEKPANDNVLSYTDPDGKTITITMGEAVVSDPIFADGKAKVKVLVANGIADMFCLSDAPTAPATTALALNDVFLSVTAEADDGTALTVSSGGLVKAAASAAKTCKKDTLEYTIDLSGLKDHVSKEFTVTVAVNRLLNRTTNVVVRTLTDKTFTYKV